MSGSVVLDIALVLLLLAYGYSGYRQGLIQSVFSLVGFFVFAMFAVWQLPGMLARWTPVADDDRTRVLVLILGVVAFGWLGQYLGSLLGARSGARSGRRRCAGSTRCSAPSS